MLELIDKLCLTFIWICLLLPLIAIGAVYGVWVGTCTVSDQLIRVWGRQ